MDDLKACPFCGGHGEIVRDRFSDVEWAYCCHSCELIGPTGKDEDHARRAWNTRADDAEVLRLRAEVERLAKELNHALARMNAAVVEIEHAERIARAALKGVSNG